MEKDNILNELLDKTLEINYIIAAKDKTCSSIIGVFKKLSSLSFIKCSHLKIYSHYINESMDIDDSIHLQTCLNEDKLEIADECFAVNEIQSIDLLDKVSCYSIVKEHFSHYFTFIRKDFPLGLFFFKGNLSNIELQYLTELLKSFNAYIESFFEVDSECIFKKFISNIMSCYFMIDEKNRVIDINSIGANTLQASASDIIGKDILSFTRKDNSDFADFIADLKAKSKLNRKVTFKTSKQKRVHFFIKGYKSSSNSYIIIADDITQEEVKAKLLQDKEMKYRSMYLQAPLAYQSLNIDGNIIDVNPMWQQILGYTKEEVIGKNFSEFLSQKSKPGFKIQFPIFKAKGFIHDVQFQMVKKNGNNIFVSFEGCIGYRADGIVRQTYCTFKDITTEFNMELELKESEERYKSIFEKSYSIMLIINPENGYILDANIAACNFYGYTINEIKKIRIHDINISNEGDVSGNLQNVRTSTKHVFQFKHQKSNGTISDVEVYASIITIGGKNCVFSIVHDISKRILAETERKHATAELKDALVLNTNILQNASEGIIVYDKDRKYQLWNKFMVKTIGLTQNDVLGKTTAEIFDSATYDKIKLGIDKALSGEKVVFDIVQFYSPTKKEWGFTQEVFSPNYDSHGNIVGVICMINDITKLVATQKNLQDKNTELFDLNSTLKKNLIELEIAKERAEQSDKLKSAFLANMSHEIRTPLNAIVGFADLFDASLRADELKSYTEIIKRNNDILLKLISDIIDFSRIEAGIIDIERERFDLVPLLNDLYITYKKNKIETNIDLALHCEHNDLIINSDRNRVYQILVNLLNNAYKFTSTGQIEFGIQSYNESSTTFFVKDSGCGINDTLYNKIFERFYQIDSLKQGTGLGLSICKALVNKLDGDIWITSNEKQGSSFYFRIENDA